MRDDLSTAAFKYGGKVKVVGYITNKVTAQSNTHISAFAGIGNSINALMKIFFENADEMYEKYVPQAVREYIESRGDVPPAIKKANRQQGKNSVASGSAAENE